MGRKLQIITNHSKQFHDLQPTTRKLQGELAHISNEQPTYTSAIQRRACLLRRFYSASKKPECMGLNHPQLMRDWRKAAVRERRGRRGFAVGGQF